MINFFFPFTQELDAMVEILIRSLALSKTKLNLQSCFNEERSELLVRTKELHELQNEAVVRHENFVKLQNDYNDLLRIKMEMQNQLETYKNLQLIDRREES